MLQQYLPLAVLKPFRVFDTIYKELLVATVLTACGIETQADMTVCYWNGTLQQYLPLAVLKPNYISRRNRNQVYGSCNSTYRLRYWNISGARTLTSTFLSVATVLTACGIETRQTFLVFLTQDNPTVATVLTACGIETSLRVIGKSLVALVLLQQYLPLAVLKQP